MAFLLAAISICGGFSLTYVYERRATVIARAAAGVALGFALLGFAGFIFASLTGMDAASLALAAVVAASPLLLFAKTSRRETARADFAAAKRNVSRALSQPNARVVWQIVFYALVVIVLWQVFARAFYERGGELFTGVDNNLGDLPFHIGIVESFARGGNFPPQHPEYAGAKLSYPFLVDFVAAIFVRAGATLEGAFFWESFALILSLVVLLERFARKLTRSALAASLTIALVLLSGGLGWISALREAWNSGLGVLDYLSKLPHDYTLVSNHNYAWGNALTTLFVPQRGFLLGLPLALITFTLWWQFITKDETEMRVEDETKEQSGASKKDAKRKRRKRNEASLKSSSARKGEATVNLSASASNASVAFASEASKESGWRALFAQENFRRMVAAGIVAGLLPLAHAHSYLVVMTTGACLALLFARTLDEWKLWILSLAVASLLGAPQILFVMAGSATKGSSFFKFNFGWDSGGQNAILFWLKNAGLFIPLLIIAIAWLARRANSNELESNEREHARALLLFHAPFALFFVVPNLMTLAPWVWDNIKVLFYWWVASAPLVALLLAEMWRAATAKEMSVKIALRVAVVALVCGLTFAGALDVWRVVSGTSEQREFDRQGVAFGELVAEKTPPGSVILFAPTYNHPVTLSGRVGVMGYAGHLWSQGIDYAARERDVSRIYAGAADADELLRKYKVNYVVVSPLERATLGAGRVNEKFFERYEKIGETGGYKLYKIGAR